MPYQKLKREDYANLGGIATKQSPYTTGPHQFLSLVNFDFSTPGSLTKVPGSTQYLETSSSLAGKCLGLMEFERSTGFSQIVYGLTGSMWSISASTITGWSITQIGATQAALNGYVHWYWDAGAGWFPLEMTGASIGTTPRHQETQFNATLYINSSSHSGAKKSFVSFQNHVFMADGVNFLKWDGSTVTRVGLPFPVLWGAGAGDTFSQVNTLAASFSQIKYTNYLVAAQYINTRGFAGPLSYICSANYYSISLTAQFIRANVFIPLGYGITGVRFWGATSPGSTTGNFALYPKGQTGWLYDYRYVGDAPILNGSTTYCEFLFYPPVNPGQQLTTDPYWRGYTLLTQVTGATVSAAQLMDAPQFLEVYNNQMITAGHSGAPSTIRISDIAEPENYDPENFIDVRTNDGDAISGLKSYNSRCYVFKYNSMHELSGDDPTNFALREVSDQYGCVNHWSTAVFNDTMLFLDKKGVMVFNGANLEPLSNDIQPIIDRINQSAAKTEACMVHSPSQNQVLVSVPVDGATLNNMTLVYDYFVKAWTTHEGYRAAAFANMGGRIGARTLFYGGYSGMIFNFGASLMSHNGTAFTCLIKTRYLSELGQSVQKQFRRLYMNTDTTPGQTTALSVKAYPDYGSGASLSTTMYLTQFQNRIDFGVSAKSLAFEFSHYSSTQGIRVHGWATEARPQRNV